jgi:outer membrane protein OmpA-like peptidoglycan-associated protein
VFFVRGEPTLISTSYPELNKLAKILVENPTLEIELSGHTDNVGDAGKNQILSEQRVEVVKKYLVSKGASENRITGKGYGGSKPIADNSVEATRKLNRRVEFKITKF